MGWSLSGAADVTGVVSGSTVTYSGILPDTTVSDTAGASGTKESIVLSSAAADASWTFPLDVSGVVPSLDAEGAVQFTDSTGAVVARIPLPFASDSNVNPETGDPAQTWNVKYTLAQTDTGWALTTGCRLSWPGRSAE